MRQILAKTYPEIEDIYRFINKAQLKKKRIRFSVRLPDLTTTCNVLRDADLKYEVKEYINDALVIVHPSEIDYESQSDLNTNELLEEMFSEIDKIPEQQNLIEQVKEKTPAQLQAKKYRDHRKEKYGDKDKK